MVKTEQRASFQGRSRRIALRILRHESINLLLVLAAVIGIASSVTGGMAATRSNMMNTLLRSSISGVAAIGQSFVILTAGIDLSVGGVGLFASIIGASLMTHSLYQNPLGVAVPVGIGIITILGAGAGLGAVNGLSVSRLGVPSLIATLAMWQIAKGLGFAVCKGLTIHRLPDALSFFGSGAIGGFPVPGLIFIAGAVIAYLVLNFTTYGRSLYAVGGNASSAWLSGINVKRQLLTVYVISGFCAGLAGVMFTGRILCASMGTLLGLEIDSIIAASLGGISLMGGRGNIIGVVIGVLILGVINNTLSLVGADPAVQGLAKGAIIFSAVSVDVLRRRDR